MIRFSKFVPRTGVRLAPWVQDAIVAMALFVAALAIRLPFLMLLPSFTDESVEVLHSLAILHGTPILLTNADPYYGSLFNYLIAGVFYLFGPSAENARLAVTWLGAATVPLCYFFAKEMQDRRTGFLAALMMLTSAALIVNSHIAWENETTPFFATLTFLLFVLALKRGSGPLLVAAGFCFGLTLQTHPGVILLGIGLVLCFIYSAVRHRTLELPRSLRGWLVTAGPYLALLGAALGYANVIAQNIQHPFSGWIAAQTHAYAFMPTQTLDSYLADFQNFWIMVLRMSPSSFDSQATPIEYLLVPINVLYLALLVSGVVYAFKTGKLMPVIILVVTGVMLPYFSKSYRYPESTRYVGYLFPLLYLLTATPLTRAIKGASSKISLAGLWLLVAFLVVTPAITLYGVYQRQEAVGDSNDQVLAVHDALWQQYQSRAISEVLIDKKAKGDPLGLARNVERAEDYLFTLDGVPHHSLDLTPETLEAEMQKAGAKGVGVIVGTQVYRTLSAGVRLSALSTPLPDGVTYGAFVAQR